MQPACWTDYDAVEILKKLEIQPVLDKLYFTRLTCIILLIEVRLVCFEYEFVRRMFCTCREPGRNLVRLNHPPVWNSTLIVAEATASGRNKLWERIVRGIRNLVSFLSWCDTWCFWQTRVFRCLLCAKIFSRKDSLSEHNRIHSEDKPFGCTTCSKSFARADYLNYHSRLHSDPRNRYKVSCKSGNKDFRHKSRLNVHIRSHIGIRRYACRICDTLSKIVGSKSPFVDI